MLTQFVTILIIVSVIGCILYGRRLIRTEKVDAVFGILKSKRWNALGNSWN